MSVRSTHDTDRSPAPSSVRIGLVHDARYVPTEIADLVAWAAERTDLEITHLILVSPPAARPRGRVQRWLSRLSEATFARLTTAETAALNKGEELAGYRPQIDLAGLIPGLVVLQATDLAEIEQAGLEVLIQCGEAEVPAALRGCVPFGVLGFRYGNAPAGTAQWPPGFAEVLRQEPTTAFTLRHLDATGQRILRTGSYPTDPSYPANRAAIALVARGHLYEVLDRLATQRQLPPVLVGGGAGDEPAAAVEAYAAPRTRIPHVGTQLRYAIRRAQVSAAFRLQRLLHREPTWSVGFQPVPWTEVNLREAAEIPNPPGSFLADPFVIAHEGRHYCFAEEFPFATEKGIIAVYALQGTESERLGVALEEDFHLSFPNVFHHDGELYMVPETLGAGEIRAYRCVEFPLRWEFSHTLLAGVDACDTLLLPHEGRWWMLTNIDPSGLKKPGSELHAFWSDSPIATQWHPHPGNPVVTDAQAARNGGILFDGEEVFRVTQRLGFTTYGVGAMIRRIRRLDPESFDEVVVRQIDPDFLPTIKGNHHLHSNGNYTVFDYYR